VLMDEPFGALDAITRFEMQEWFGELRALLGFTAILVTHDIREAFRLADRIAVLRCGGIEQVGTTSDLGDTPATPYVRELLGRAGALS
jgi:ABC-type proline/glycine betaine transport system ATPase subunit